MMHYPFSMKGQRSQSFYGEKHIRFERIANFHQLSYTNFKTLYYSLLKHFSQAQFFGIVWDSFMGILFQAQNRSYPKPSQRSTGIREINEIILFGIFLETLTIETGRRKRIKSIAEPCCETNSYSSSTHARPNSRSFPRVGFPVLGSQFIMA